MPIYDFRNTETNEIEERMMSIASMEQFLNDNPVWQIQITSAPSIGDPVRLGIHKTPQSFRDLLGHIKKGNVRSNINNDS